MAEFESKEDLVESTDGIPSVSRTSDGGFETDDRGSSSNGGDGDTGFSKSTTTVEEQNNDTASSREKELEQQAEDFAENTGSSGGGSSGPGVNNKAKVTPVDDSGDPTGQTETVSESQLDQRFPDDQKNREELQLVERGESKQVQELQRARQKAQQQERRIRTSRSPEITTKQGKKISKSEALERLDTRQNVLDQNIDQQRNIEQGREDLRELNSIIPDRNNQAAEIEVRRELKQNPELLRLQRSFEDRNENTGAQGLTGVSNSFEQDIRGSDLTRSDFKEFDQLVDDSGISENRLNVIAGEERANIVQEDLSNRFEGFFDNLANPPQGTNTGLTGINDQTGSQNNRLENDQGLSTIFEDNSGTALSAEQRREFVAEGAAGAIAEVVNAPQRRGGQAAQLSTGELSVGTAAAATAKEGADLVESAKENPERTGLTLIGSGVASAPLAAAGPSVSTSRIPNVDTPNLRNRLPDDFTGKDFVTGDLGTNVQEKLLVKRGGRPRSDIEDGVISQEDLSDLEIVRKQTSDEGTAVRAQIPGETNQFDLFFKEKDVTRRDVVRGVASDIQDLRNADQPGFFDSLTRQSIKSRREQDILSQQKLIEREKTSAEKTDATGEDLDIDDVIEEVKSRQPDTSAKSGELEFERGKSGTEFTESSDFDIPITGSFEDEAVDEASGQGFEQGLAQDNVQAQDFEDIEILDQPQDTGQGFHQIFAQDNPPVTDQEEIVPQDDELVPVRRFDDPPNRPRTDLPDPGDGDENNGDSELLAPDKDLDVEESIGAELLNLKGETSTEQAQNPLSFRRGF